jgi:hypothetical protein
MCAKDVGGLRAGAHLIDGAKYGTQRQGINGVADFEKQNYQIKTK